MDGDDDDWIELDFVYGVYFERKKGEYVLGMFFDSLEDNVENVYEGLKFVLIFY